MSTDTAAWAQIQRWLHGVHGLFSQLRALRGATEDEKQAWVSEDSCAYGGMCSGEKDHREQKAFHTHYSYVSSSWKAKESQVEE